MILLAPDLETFENMKREVECEEHPEHIVTTSPEQDYLTRYFWHTPHWTHIDVSCNFQLHHLALKLADRDQSDPRRQLPYEDVRILHFSAHPKPSQRQEAESEKEFVERMVERYEGFQILVNHDPEAIEKRNRKGLYPELKLEGEKLYEARRGGNESDSEDGNQEITVNPMAVEQVRGFLASAARDWDLMEKASQEHHPLTPAPLAEVGDRLRGTCCAWDGMRGVGWVQPDSGMQKIFVHHTQVEGIGRVHLTVGQHVWLTVGKDDKDRIAATCVRKECGGVQVQHDPEAVGQQVVVDRVPGECARWKEKFGFISYLQNDVVKEIFVHQDDLLVDIKLSKPARGGGLKAGQQVQFSPSIDDQGRSHANLVTCTEKDNELVKSVLDFLTSELSAKDFPPELTSWQRRVIHKMAELHGLCTESIGQGEERFVRVSRTRSQPSESECKMEEIMQKLGKMLDSEVAQWPLELAPLTGVEREKLRSFCDEQGLVLYRPDGCQQQNLGLLVFPKARLSMA